MKLSCSLLLILSTALPTASEIIDPLAPQETTLVADALDMRSTLTETTAVFTGNVILEGTNMKIACDRLEIIAARIGDREATIGEFRGFKYLLATGNVRIEQGDREATCGRAEVLPQKEQVVLYEDPVVIDHSSDFIAAGSRITLFRGERRMEIENPKLTGPPIQDLGPEAAEALSTEETTPETTENP